MALMMLSLFLYAGDVYGEAEGASGGLRDLFRAASAAIATPILLLLGVPLATRGLSALRGGRVTTELLVASAAVAAWALSVVSLARGQGGIYFESAALAVLLASLGRYLEAAGRSAASALLGPAVDLAPEPVTLLDAEGRATGAVAPALLRPGDRVLVFEGDAAPADLRASSPAELDLAVLTGEPAPVSVREGDLVPAGAVPLSRPLAGVVVREPRESTLERLGALARSLLDRPGPLQRTADRFATFLVPLVLAAASATLVARAFAGDLEGGVVRALAVTLVACPCTYGVAAPLVHWLALRRALAEGVLLRDAAALERLARVDRVAFDKTGTLAARGLAVTGADLAAGADPGEVRGLVRALESGTSHPIGRALLAWAGGAAERPLAFRRAVPGAGVFGVDGRLPVSLGPAAGDPDRIALVRGGVELASFSFDETLHPTARRALDDLRALGVPGYMLSGDPSSRPSELARALGLPVEAGLTPEEKVGRLGRRDRSSTAMVGDGQNDVPALAGAGVGFAVEGATGLARGVASASLLRDDLRLVPWSLRLARRARRTTLGLLAASTAYNLVFVALAAAGLLLPVWAGVAMLGSSFLTLAFASRVAGWPGLER